jgi:hypothetical protein
MFEINKSFNAAEISDGNAKRRSVETSIRRFCDSLARRIHLWQSSATPERDEVAPSSASLEAGPPVQHPVNRIIKQGRFDWGSFSAFEDGSIEVDRGGVKQWFRNFSELKRSLKYRRGGVKVEQEPPPFRASRSERLS